MGTGSGSIVLAIPLDGEVIMIVRSMWNMMRKTLVFQSDNYPGKLASGDNYIVKEALVYTKGGQQYVITLVFNIDIK